MADTRIVTKKLSETIKVQNIDLFQKYDDADKKILELARNSMLEIFPLSGTAYDPISIKLAENFGHTIVEIFSDYKKTLEDSIDKKLEALKSLIPPATPTI